MSARPRELDGSSTSKHQLKPSLSRNTETMAIRLSLPKEIEASALAICNKASQLKLARGWPDEMLALSSIYLAARQEDYPLSLHDLAKISNKKIFEIAKHYRLLVNRLGGEPVLPSDPSKCVDKIAQKLGSSSACVNMTLIMLDQIKVSAYEHSKHHNSDLTPFSGGIDSRTVAGSMLYLACVKIGEHVTQKDISIACGVAEQSIRNTVKKLSRSLL